MNKIALDGRLTRDAEVKFTPSGNSVLNFSVASDVGFGDNKTTNFFSCNKWGESAEKLAPYLTKGQQVTVYGTLSTREYQAKDGTKKTTIEIRVDDISLQGGAKEKSDNQQQEKQYSSVKKPARQYAEDIDDSIPF